MEKLQQRLMDLSSLAELCHRYPAGERLLQQWHPTKNRHLPPYGVTLTPDSVAPTDKRRVWWQCAKGHAWPDSVANRVEKVLTGQDTGCIFCKPETIRRAPMLWDYCLGDVPDGEVDCSHLLDEWDTEKNAPLTPRDVKTLAYCKVWWRCAAGHSWAALVANRVKAGVGCPYCGHRKVLAGFNDLAFLHPELAAQWDHTKNPIGPAEVTAKSNRKVWWLCPAGHSYEKTVANRTQGGQGCPVCRALAGEKGSMLLPGVNDLATTHPAVAAQWNNERNTLSPAEVKAGSRQVVWWRCDRGHEWQTPVARRTGKRPIGCPVCAAASIKSKRKGAGQ